MKRLTTALLIAVLAVTAHAQFTFKGQLRVRSEMNTLQFANSDAQKVDRLSDLRFRPTFEYKVNDQLNVVYTGEVGDITFGSKKDSKSIGQGTGGGLDADGVNWETKNVYMDYSATPEHAFRLGIFGWADLFSAVNDKDYAGIQYTGKFDAVTLKAAWLIEDDQDPKVSGSGEVNWNKSTYSLGTQDISFDASYALDKEMKIGLHTLINMAKVDSSASLGTGVKGSYNKTAMYFAPYFAGKPMPELKIEAEFIYNMRSFAYDYAENTANLTKHKDPDSQSGMAFLFRSGYAATPEFTAGVNFLFASGDDKGKDYYRGNIDHFTNMGLEILGTNGSCDSYGLNLKTFGAKDANGNDIEHRLGIMMPVLHGSYAITKDASIGAAFGYAMTAADATYSTTNSSGVAKADNKDTAIGMEFDINGSVKLAEKLSITPFAAFFMPGDMFQVAKSGSTVGETETAAMQMEIGLKAQINF